MILDFVAKKPFDIPNVLKSTNNVFLFSHMRANTSLFGHILGDNPEIMGYYEQHISYFSWKSEYRLKMLFLENHNYKNDAKYFFDKILHNNHYVYPGMLNDNNNKLIFMLRAPEQTLPSIVKLYTKLDPNHEYATPKGAAEYYLGRLKGLQYLVENLNADFLYLDAEDLVDKTDKALNQITEFLNLSTPLKPEYSLDVMTGVPGAGDSSEAIQQGKISNAAVKKYSLDSFSEEQLESCKLSYQTVRDFLRIKSINNEFS